MKTSIKFQCLAIITVIAVARLVLARILSADRPIPVPEVLRSNDAYAVACPSGNKLNVEFDGIHGKPVLVFLHGLNSSSSQWFYQRLFFRISYRLMFIDLPGHGKSAKPADLSIGALAEDLRHVLNYFDIENAILYGHSLGAMAVMKFCIENPDADVKGIIIQHSTHTNVLTTTTLAPFLRPLQNSFIIPFLRFSLNNYPVIWALGIFNHLNGLSLLFFRFLYFSGKQTRAQIEFKTRIAALTSPKTVALALLELIKLDLTKDLKKITMRTLVLAAYNDRITTVEANEYIASQITGSQLNYVKTGHLSIMENFNEVNRKVNRFIVGLV